MYSLFEYRFSNVYVSSFDVADLILPLYKVTSKLVFTLSISLSSNPYSIVVLDDVFSELDINRKKEVYEILKKFDQVFITGCDKKDLESVENFVSYQIKNMEIKKEEI